MNLVQNCSGLCKLKQLLLCYQSHVNIRADYEYGQRFITFNNIWCFRSEIVPNKIWFPAM
jgi:hypothetical protein